MNFIIDYTVNTQRETAISRLETFMNTLGNSIMSAFTGGLFIF